MGLGIPDYFAGNRPEQLLIIMDLKFFSLDSALGTARTLVHWASLSADQKTYILLSSLREPDQQILDLVLSEGNPLHVEIAFRSLRNSLGLRARATSEEVEKLAESLNSSWRNRLGFSPWDLDPFPLKLASDFYDWLRGESVDGPCAELELWANSFFERGQFERKVIIENAVGLRFLGAVGVLTVGVRQRKLSCADAAELFLSSVASSYDNECCAYVSWDVGLTLDYAMVLAAFLSAIACEDDSDEMHQLRIPLREIIYNLPQLIIRDESVEPLLNIPERALDQMLRLEHHSKRKHDYSLLRQRIAADNDCPRR